MRRVALGVVWVLLLAGSAAAQSELALADDTDWAALREHGQQLLERLRELKAPLPDTAERSVREVLARAEKRNADKLQELLDAHCLLGITINPESRVKAARGPA